MASHQRSRFTDSGILVSSTAPGGGTHTTECDVFAGAVAYWALDSRHWSPVLASMRTLGFTAVTVPVPWGIHDRGDQGYDFSGNRDLGVFLDRIAAAGLWAIVRPGPLLEVGVSYAALPERLLQRSDLYAVSGRGGPVWLPSMPRMFPLPSLASTGFHHQIGQWLIAIGEIVGPRSAPYGPVVALEIGGAEVGHVLQCAAYEIDYHPDALVWWREFRLLFPNSKHDSDDEPPRAWDRAATSTCARWSAFRHHYLRRYLGIMQRAIAAAGLESLPRFSSIPEGNPGHMIVGSIQAAIDGPAALTVGHLPSDRDRVRRRGLLLANSARPLPLASSMAFGSPAMALPIDAAEQRRSILELLSAGLRGFSLTWAADAPRWHGAPIDTSGVIVPQADWTKRLLRALDDSGWTKLRRYSPVAVVVSRADMRHAMASATALAPLRTLAHRALAAEFIDDVQLGRDSGALEYQRWLSAVLSALDLNQVPYALVDEDCSEDMLANYAALISPTLDRVDRGLWNRLCSLAQQGQTVVIGPGLPTRDEFEQPLSIGQLPTRIGRIRADSLTDLDGLADDLLSLAGDLADEWIASEQSDVDCSVFYASEPSPDQAATPSRPRILFVSHRHRRPVRAEVFAPGQAQLTDAVDGSNYTASSQGIIEIPLAPRAVRMFYIS